MRYECKLCGFAPEEFGRSGMFEARLHARQVHDLKTGYVKGGDLQINSIPTYFGEVATSKPKPTSWLAELFKRREERKKAGQYVAPLPGGEDG